MADRDCAVDGQSRASLYFGLPETYKGRCIDCNRSGHRAGNPKCWVERIRKAFHTHYQREIAALEERLRPRPIVIELGRGSALPAQMRRERSLSTRARAANPPQTRPPTNEEIIPPDNRPTRFSTGPAYMLQAQAGSNIQSSQGEGQTDCQRGFATRYFDPLTPDTAQEDAQHNR